MSEDAEKSGEAEAPKAEETKTQSPARSDAGNRPERGRGGRGARGGRDGENKGRGRGRRGDRDRDDSDRGSEFHETLIDIYRCSATVKGGRRLSFGALVAVGDGKGRVGIGYGKAKEVPGAIQKAIKKGRAEMKRFPLIEGDTIPHQIKGRFKSSEVILIPAKPGTGVIAGAAVKAILEAGGLKNVLTKSVGSNNTRNIVKATMEALERLRDRKLVESLRGVSLAAQG